MAPDVVLLAAARRESATEPGGRARHGSELARRNLRQKGALYARECEPRGGKLGDAGARRLKFAAEAA
jgi:hypothetical protein